MADPEALQAVEPAVESTTGLRSRLSRIMNPGGAPVNPELEPVLRTLRQFHPKSETKVVFQAYQTAEYLHREQRRRSGEPYITHPVAVAQILADLGMTAATLAAALLHDTVEDTGYTLKDLRAEFGDEIASLVDGVTKLDKVTYGEASAAETVRKMVVAMARDIRVLVIKLADRLHNMRTLQWLPPEKQAVEGPRDAGDLRPAGPSAGHEHREVGARGPRVRDPAPEDVRGDRPPGQPARPRARAVPRARSSPTWTRSCARAGSGRR